MEPMIKKLKRISKMPFPVICRKIYSRIKKRRPPPPGAVYDAYINPLNLETCRDEGQLHIAGDFVPMRKSPVRWFKVYSRGLLLGKVQPKPKDSRGRLPVDFKVPLCKYHDKFEFYVELDNGSRGFLGSLELSDRAALRDFEKELPEKSRDIAVPPPEIIYLTQGHREAEVYLRSVPRAVYKLKQIFVHMGIPFGNMRTILDFGCGSGRVVRGLYADDPSREIYGADYNEELIAWAKKSLPADIHFIKNELDPPLPVEDQKFDLIFLVSVFTHLPLESQHKWLAEFRRVLKKGGILVISLHGMTYLNNFRIENPEAYETLMSKGYTSSYEGSGAAAGSNEYYTAHLPEYALQNIFQDWQVLAHLPGGRIDGQLVTFNVLGFSGPQDLYILTS